MGTLIRQADSLNVEELSHFDAASYLDSEAAIAAYSTDIVAANDAALRRAALGDSGELDRLLKQGGPL